MIKNPEFITSLINQGLITKEDAGKLSDKYKGNDYDVMMHLLRGGALKKDHIGRMWGDSAKVSYVNLTKTVFQTDVVNKLPEKFARQHKVIPVYMFGDVVTLATWHPFDSAVMVEAERFLNKQVSPVFAFKDEIEDAIEIQYKTKGSINELIDNISENSLFKITSKITPEQLKQISGEQSIVVFTKALILLAVKDRSSDIHVEPSEDVVRIRFRIDGVLQERLKLDVSILQALVTRLKVMANLDITERRRPQDGRLTVSLSSRSIDIRMSTVPTICGEKVVLRILGQVDRRDAPNLQELGLSRSVHDKIIKVVESPNGVFFVTGPTGSGKTTTLYGVLNYLNKIGTNIMTIEDPVEIRLPGTNQIQVNHEINLDFSSALRSFLRQDPDIILVGEIRDTETAKIASQAALTGHLVLTTMHTNSSLQAVTRLVEIGVEPFLVAPSIIGVMAQRLVRKLCDGCKESFRLSDEAAQNYFSDVDAREVVFYKALGCEKCGHTGYFGRVAIHEIFLINDETRRLIARDASILDIEEYALGIGFEPMRYDGIKKAMRGLTTLEEVDRVTVEN